MPLSLAHKAVDKGTISQAVLGSQNIGYRSRSPSALAGSCLGGAADRAGSAQMTIEAAPVGGCEYRTRDAPEYVEGDIAMTLGNCSNGLDESTATHTDNAARARGVRRGEA
jgi:hypothetical protein